MCMFSGYGVYDFKAMGLMFVRAPGIMLITFLGFNLWCNVRSVIAIGPVVLRKKENGKNSD